MIGEFEIGKVALVLWGPFSAFWFLFINSRVYNGPIKEAKHWDDIARWR